ISKYLRRDQEAGKPAWPRPVGGYQTITGGRYGRRHACVGFRPYLNSQDRGEHQYYGDCEQLELEDVQSGIFLYDLQRGLPANPNEPLSENTGTGEPICRSVSTQTVEGNTSSFSLFSYGLEGRQISRNSVNTYGKSEDLAEYASGEHNDLNDQNGIAFVNIDSHKPDSSDGEEDDAQDGFSLAREKAGVFPGTLDNMLPELVKDSMPFSDLESQLSALSHSISGECCEAAGPVPLMTYSDLACSNNRTFKLYAEDQTIPKSNTSDVNCEIQQIQSIVDAGFRTPIAIANELSVSDGKIDESSSPECVVRPKIRKQNTVKQLERVKLLPSGDEENEFAEVQQSCGECGSKEEMSSSIFFDSRDCEGDREDTEIDLRKNAAAQEQKSVLDFWNEIEDRSRRLSVSHRDEYSSERSDGERSTTVSTYFTATEKGQSSSGESWATVPGKEEREPEVQSSSSGVEENTNVFQGGPQAFPDPFLEEGESPWLQYRGGLQSSSDVENDLLSDFMRPGFFLLDGNNNLEDDSSVSEDLDVEWRVLDEADGLRLAQAFPYVNPQYLSSVAVEERLHQAMENALAHLELLGIEQAPPPATKETIECLPQIVVTDDHDGEEQRCTVCCSEYVRGEIMTELPCHHLFHKPCVTLWLQEVSTQDCLCLIQRKFPPPDISAV
uniref:RING-type domain-containing protein n=1 Tax=Athene cunicularia TaxID=194338 RepID=A0A663MWH0_ATHCN